MESNFQDVRCHLSSSNMEITTHAMISIEKEKEIITHVMISFSHYRLSQLFRFICLKLQRLRSSDLVVIDATNAIKFYFYFPVSVESVKDAYTFLGNRNNLTGLSSTSAVKSGVYSQFVNDSRPRNVHGPA